MAHRGSGSGPQGRHAEGHGAPPAGRPDRLAVLRQHIVRLADKAPGSQHLPEAEEQLELLAQALKRDLVAYEEQILQITLECTWELPHKLPYYAALLGLLNIADYNFVQRAVEAVHASLQAALTAHDTLTIALGLRILAALAASLVVSPSALVRLFHSLVTDAVAALDSGPSWQARGDWYVYCVMGALPWGGHELAMGAGGALSEVLDLAHTYCQHRHHCAMPARHAITQLPDGTPTDKAPDYVEAVHAGVAAVAAEGKWKMKSVARPQEAFLSRLQSAEAHSLPPLTLPPLPALSPDLSPLATAHARWQALEAYPPPLASLAIFPKEKTEEGLSGMDAWVVSQLLGDVLRSFNGARKECTIFLVNLPVPFRHEYATADAVFSHLMHLPSPPARPVFYAVVLADLCKALPAAFPAVTAQAIHALFPRIPQMDVEARTRLAHWMAHHLSNFGLSWGWEEWSGVASLPPWHPQRRFCATVLEREVRLSYWDKVRETLPDALAPLMPPRPHPGAAPSEAEGGGASAALSAELSAMVRNKTSSKEVAAWVESAVVPQLGRSGALAMVAPTLLTIGSKTVTHMLTMLERYQPLLARLAPDRAAQAELVAVAANFWADAPQMAGIAIDRLMAFRLASNLAIVDWAFSPPVVATLHVSDTVGEVLERALAQTGHRASDLAASLTDARSASSAAAAAVSRMETAVGLEAEGAAARAREEAQAAAEGVEVKEALYARAVEEQQTLMVAVVDQLANAIAQRHTQQQQQREQGTLTPTPTPTSPPQTQTATPPADALPGAGEAGQPSDMEVDADADADADGEGAAEAAAEAAAMRREEGDAWIAAARGHLRVIVRQHAHQLWSLAAREKLEVLTRGDVPIMVRQDVHEALCYVESENTEETRE